MDNNLPSCKSVGKPCSQLAQMGDSPGPQQLSRRSKRKSLETAVHSTKRVRGSRVCTSRIDHQSRVHRESVAHSVVILRVSSPSKSQRAPRTEALTSHQGHSQTVISSSSSCTQYKKNIRLAARINEPAKHPELDNLNNIPYLKHCIRKCTYTHICFLRSFCTINQISTAAKDFLRDQ